MHWNDWQKQFSTARMGRYLVAFPGKQAHAIAAYTHNLLLTEALNPYFSVVEIALRNGIQRQLASHYGRPDWWEAWRGDAKFADVLQVVEQAKQTLYRRKEAVSPDKIVAELTFGFWTTLFNAKYQLDLWRALRLVFPHCPKSIRQRHTISSALNEIRILRNRAFHHEPLLWLSPALIQQYESGLQVLKWIEPALVDWLVPLDRLPRTWALWKSVEASLTP